MGKLEIHFNEVPHSRPIKKFIHSNVMKWLHARLIHSTEWVRVDFFRSPLDHKVGCYIEVKNGRYLWRNFEYGRGIQDTFSHCLKHLVENTRIERRAS